MWVWMSILSPYRRDAARLSLRRKRFVSPWQGMPSRACTSARVRQERSRGSGVLVSCRARKWGREVRSEVFCSAEGAGRRRAVQWRESYRGSLRRHIVPPRSKNRSASRGRNRRDSMMRRHRRSRPAATRVVTIRPNHRAGVRAAAWWPTAMPAIMATATGTNGIFRICLWFSY